MFAEFEVRRLLCSHTGSVLVPLARFHSHPPASRSCPASQTHVNAGIYSQHAPAMSSCASSVQASVAAYEGLYQQYSSLAYSLGQAPDIALSLDPQQQLTEARTAMAAVTAMGGRGGHGHAVHPHGHGDGGMAAAAAAAAAGGGARRSRSEGGGSYLLGSGSVVTARDGSEVPQLVSDGGSLCSCCWLVACSVVVQVQVLLLY